MAQFRPEKDYPKQIEAFRRLQTAHPDAELWLVGHCRNAGDEQRVEELQRLADGLPVQFFVNQNFDTLLSLAGRATVGLHTMWNEHFGISVVEMLAAGLITLAHNSCGPKLDIIDEGRTGFLADTVDSYVEQLTSIFDRLD
jgi:alpha-1,2-mannosyltransferase